jgi:phage-related protein
MPKTEIAIYKEEDGNCPLLEWLDKLSEKAKYKCIVKIERLEEMGYELRRPEADILDNEVYELRIALQGIQYRILYFFYNKLGVISHGLIKTGDRVPQKDINLTAERKKKYGKYPTKHTYEGGVS